MSRGTKFALGIISGILIAVGCLFVFVRYHDGPLEIISGGPFKSGELTSNPEDWSALSNKMTVELQTMVPPRSRTMWLIVEDGRMFVVSRYMNTSIGKIWKQWPRTLDQDNAAIIRAEGKLYHLQLERILRGEIVARVLENFNRKYRTDIAPDEIDSGNAWLFELVDR